MELRSRVAGALGTLALSVPAAALLVHCSSFGASEEAADGGDGAALVEAGSVDAPDAASASDADAGDGAQAAFCASAGVGLVCEDFERPGALGSSGYEVVNQVSLESPGFRSAYGIVATTGNKTNAVLAVPYTLTSNAKHITISAAIRFDAAPTNEVDLVAVDIGGRTLELFVTDNLTVGFASCEGASCEDLTAGTKKLVPGTYARLELILDFNGASVTAGGTVDGAPAFSGPIAVSAAATGTSFSSMFGVVYSEKSISVHVDDVLIQAN